MDRQQERPNGRLRSQTIVRMSYAMGLVGMATCLVCLIVIVARHHSESTNLQSISRIRVRNLPDPGPMNNNDVRKGPGGPWSDGQYTFYCGNFHTGQPATVRIGAAKLRTANWSYVTPADGCLRVFCIDTSAVYVCNDRTDAAQTLWGSDIAWMTERMGLLCCDAYHGISAQLFHPTDGWNTVVGYGNCRHAANETPAEFGVGNGGINGNCVPNESQTDTGAPSSMVRVDGEGDGDRKSES